MGDVIDLASRRAEIRREVWLSKRQLASHLGATTRTLTNWQREGMPVHRVGRTCLYRASEVAAWRRLRAATPKDVDTVIHVR